MRSLFSCFTSEKPTCTPVVTVKQDTQTNASQAINMSAALLPHPHQLDKAASMANPCFVELETTKEYTSPSRDNSNTSLRGVIENTSRSQDINPGRAVSLPMPFTPESHPDTTQHQGEIIENQALAMPSFAVPEQSKSLSCLRKLEATRSANRSRSRISFNVSNIHPSPIVKAPDQPITRVRSSLTRTRTEPNSAGLERVIASLQGIDKMVMQHGFLQSCPHGLTRSGSIGTRRNPSSVTLKSGNSISKSINNSWVTEA